MTSRSPKKKVGTTVPFDENLSFNDIARTGLRMDGRYRQEREQAPSLLIPPPPPHTLASLSAASAVECIPGTVQALPLFPVASVIKLSGNAIPSRKKRRNGSDG